MMKDCHITFNVIVKLKTFAGDKDMSQNMAVFGK